MPWAYIDFKEYKILNTMLKHQNYLHYKLPITMNPDEFGKIIDQYDNKHIVQLNTTNVAVIKKIDKDNFVKFFRKGELILEWKDRFVAENVFVRTILDQKYTFSNQKLISTEIMSAHSYHLIYSYNANNLNEIKYTDTDSILSNKSTPWKN